MAEQAETTAADGVFSSGGRRLTVTGLDSGNNTKSGLNFNAPFYYRANHNDLHDNGRYGLEISAVGTNNDFQFNQYANNTLGETTGITEAQNNLIADQPWTVYTPTFYKADGTTTFSPTAQDFRFKLDWYGVSCPGQFHGTSIDIGWNNLYILADCRSVDRRYQ